MTVFGIIFGIVFGIVMVIIVMIVSEKEAKAKLDAGYTLVARGRGKQKWIKRPNKRSRVLWSKDWPPKI